MQMMRSYSHMILLKRPMVEKLAEMLHGDGAPRKKVQSEKPGHE
jgi:hypothetical protein